MLVFLAALLWLVIGGGGSTARATTGDGDVVLGAGVASSCTPGVDVNCQSHETDIVASGNTAIGGLSATGVGGAFGLEGISDFGRGVVGLSDGGDGVDAISGTNFGLFAQSLHATGAHIETESQFGAGLEVLINYAGNARGAIEAQTIGAGQGVLATATYGAGVEGHSSHGPGVLGVADASTATALKTKGKAALSGPTTLGGRSSFTGTTTFARSGRLTIPAGRAQATKTSISLGSGSSVLATIQGNQPGVYVQGVTTVTGSSGSLTIHLNKATPVNLRVAWFVLS